MRVNSGAINLTQTQPRDHLENSEKPWYIDPNGHQFGRSRRMAGLGKAQGLT